MVVVAKCCFFNRILLTTKLLYFLQEFDANHSGSNEEFEVEEEVN